MGLCVLSASLYFFCFIVHPYLLYLFLLHLINKSTNRCCCLFFVILSSEILLINNITIPNMGGYKFETLETQTWMVTSLKHGNYIPKER